MRPAYRYALAAGLATLVAVAVALWVSIPESPDPTAPPDIVVSEDHIRQPVRPEGLEPISPPVVGDPGRKARGELLDDIEAMETERFGAAEAARRRASREQLLHDRIQHAKGHED